MTAYELLSDERRWCYRAWAKDEDGLSCDPRAEEAVCWCASGAITKCYPHGSREMHKKANALAKARHSLCLSHVNDRMGYAVVLEVLKDAGV